MQLLWLAMPGVELSTIESVLWHYIIVMYLSSKSMIAKPPMELAIHRDFCSFSLFWVKNQ
jgi:hypothetical protein